MARQNHLFQRGIITLATTPICGRGYCLESNQKLDNRIQGKIRRKAKWVPVIEKIASDEEKHSEWVKQLLVNRNIEIPSTDDAEKRYWSKIGLEDLSFEDTAAAGHHAEHMRLVRIRALADSEKVDNDIREVFGKILPDEEFHEKAFKIMATEESIKKMLDKHEAGMQSLGWKFKQ
ncbi:hypothetical protein GHT06_001832 [Daphnia sinensis]|uniref:Rubrerythrin diiron-binding domain-containing protein n=1 Tax=Daphnia sinensis TaxID=1820382 RepID=A0AAD5KDI8_9CRUS|nr:hypothetical protein GHT06_001832 [Daphnia sinensis]